MLKLKELSFNGIGRFTSLQTIDFASKTNLIQVNGKNNNTGGSSGSAKSTVFHAMDYLLGINEIPATALQNRKQKDTIYACCLFDKDGTYYKIERSKKKGLCLFTVNGTTEDPIVTGSTKVAEEELDKILGLPRELVAKLVHKRQSDGGFFLNLRPKEIYEFLAKCLDLQHFNLKILELNEKSKKCENSLLTLLQEKQGLEASFSSISQAKQAFSEPPTPEILTPNSSLSLAKDAVNYELDQKLTEYNQKTIVLGENQPKGDFWEPDKTELFAKKKELEEARSKYSIELALFNSQKMAISKKQSELQNVLNTTILLQRDKERHILDVKKASDEVKSLKACECPTCLQSWIGDSAQNRVESKQLEISAKVLKLKEIDEKLATIDEQKQVLERLQTILDSMSMFPAESDYKVTMALTEGQILIIERENQSQVNAFSEKQQKEFNDYNRLVNTCKYEYEQSILPLKLRLNEFDLEMKENNLKVNSYQTSLNFYQTQVQKMENQELVLISKLNDNSLGLIENTKKRDTYLEAARCVKSYLLGVFQDSLDYIGTRATSMLSKIPHTSNSVIHFETGKENKDGTIREEITAYVNLESDVNVPICTLCGGERSAIDLAVDLAVNDLIESRSSKGFDWIVLDEPFDGNDSIGKEACLELLSSSEINRRIIIVDHGTELKSMIRDGIVVVRNGEESTIEE